MKNWGEKKQQMDIFGYLFINFKSRVTKCVLERGYREGIREIEVTNLLTHSWLQARSKPGVRNSFCVSHVGVRVQALGHPLLSQVYTQDAGSEVEYLGLKQVFTVG